MTSGTVSGTFAQMNLPPISRRCALAAALCSLLTLPMAAFAQDTTPPVVRNPLVNLNVAAGTEVSVVKVKKTFALDGVTGQIVRMATVLGNVDIEVLNDETPLNAANFLSYVNSGAYNRSFIHRSEPGFVIQGGGYYVNSGGTISAIAQGAAVKGEHVRSNTRGTLALALSQGPDSGTNQWFFNLVDNTVLDDTLDGGPFTVFGRVIESGMAVVDAIAGVPVPHPAEFVGTALADIPLLNYDAAQGVRTDEFIYLNDVVVVPLVPPSVGADSVLTLKVKNNNPDLLTATITGKKLKLFYNAGKTGTAKIKVFATNSAGTRVKSKFTVTVQ